MDYIANVENSEIDVSGIRTVLVQGDSSYPVIRFVLDPSLTGLSWRVRGTYTATNIAVLSPEIAPTESATEITLDWSVGSDFTTYDGDMQLSLVGANGTGTTVVKALADITIQKDWSIGSMGSITLNLFEQLMAQASATIDKYPYVDDATGNWFVWSPSTELWVDTGVHAQGEQGIQGIQGETGATGATGATGGNYILRTNAQGRIYEVLMMDTTDIATAQDVWRWNINGFAHSSTGYNGTYTTAMTQDGAIVADFITTGTLNAAEITVINLIADHVQSTNGNLALSIWGGIIGLDDATYNRAALYSGGSAGATNGILRLFSGNVVGYVMQDSNARETRINTGYVYVGFDKDNVSHGEVATEKLFVKSIAPRGEGSYDVSWKLVNLNGGGTAYALCAK